MMADSLEFICGCIGGHIVSAGELAKIDAVRILYGDHHGWLYGWLRRAASWETMATLPIWHTTPTSASLFRAACRPLASRAHTLHKSPKG